MAEPIKAYVFPGQGSQFTGMANDLYHSSPKAKELLEDGNDILGFKITSLMFEGSDEDLRRTDVTQPAVFLHSMAAWYAGGFNAVGAMTAGHSLGEFSALVAAGVLSFEDGLKLVMKRARAMQMACEKNPGTMAAVLGMDDDKVEAICQTLAPEIVVAANYNCPGQLVISGSMSGIALACEKLKEAGAKRALPLPVGGAFHSPLMSPAAEELNAAILTTRFNDPVCPVFQNVSALPVTHADEIKKNLSAQLTGPVKWTQTIRNMSAAGALTFYEAPPGKVLQGLIKKTLPNSNVNTL